MSASIALELFRHQLLSIAEEMGLVLRRTALSANIKERRDYSCAVYDAAGKTVAMGDHMPVHLGAMPLSVQYAIARCQPGPGDVVLLNDPFQGGTHLPDITAVAAVFLPGQRRPAFYVANRAHHADVGGMTPGSMPLAKEIYQEGIRIPPVKLVVRGELQRPILEILLANVRTPEEREGDLQAQLESLQRGAKRLVALTEKFGQRQVAQNMRALQEYAAKRMRQELLRWPAGSYEFADALEDDGQGNGPLPIRVRVTLGEGRATVDFTGTAKQTAGSVNANLAIATAATMYVFRCLLAGEVPYNEGLMRPITLVAPEGTLVNALPPAAMAAGNVETSQRITDVLLGALRQAAPGRIPQASSGTMSNLSFGGWDPVRGRPFAYYETIAGGMGAGAKGPGHDAVHTHMTNSWNTPVEALEHQYPLRMHRYALAKPTAQGKAWHRGGRGVCKEIEFLTEAQVTFLADRHQEHPGGQPGSLARNGKRMPAKCTFAVKAGDRLTITTPGGAGASAEK